MKKIEIIAVGKLKDASLRALCDDFYKRCRRHVSIVEAESRDLSQLVKRIDTRKKVIVLDERGTQPTSREFAMLLQNWLEQVDGVQMLIGGADGFDEATRKRADYVLSLSKMTLAHRLARVVLAEQLYRAVSIADGSPYHRD